MFKKLITSVILFSFIYPVLAQTIIADSTTISGNWLLSESPYIIEGRAIIAPQQVLNIEPGVEIRFKSSASNTPSWFDYGLGNVGVIRVHGSINANGTESNPVLFTRDNSGFWGGILLDENSVSSFTNCIVEYAGETRNVPEINSTISFNGGISAYKCNVNVSASVFRNNVNGFYIREVNSAINFTKNTFVDNRSNGLVIEQSTVDIINNEFYNNSKNATGFVSAIHSSGSNVFLVGNLIYNNDDFGIFTNDGGSNFIINNTIYGNWQGIRVEGGANTYIYNSIVQENNLNFATGDPEGAVIELHYSLTDDAALPQNITEKTGNIKGSEALFTNISINDFSLNSNSPCKNAGTSDTVGLKIPALDILGNARIDIGVIDIGAIEYQFPLQTREIVRDDDFMSYPNPTNGIINVPSSNYLNAKIYTLDGQFISNYDANTIDISNLKNGVYFLKIESLSGKMNIEKIIKY